MTNFIYTLRDSFRLNRPSIHKFLIKDNKKHPFALVIPGGGYSFICGYNEGDEYAKELNKEGINAFVIYYRVRGKASFPHPLDDVASSLKEILNKKEEYNLEDNYFLIGSSAGGHLATMFARLDIGYKKYNLPKPSALFLAYPVVTMFEPTHKGTCKYILGKNTSLEMKNLLSNEKNITSSFPPTYFFLGKNDEVVPPNGSLLLKEAFDKNNVKNKFIYYEDLPHGSGIGRGFASNGWIKDAIDFWKESA